jgi:hypothetical protein
MGNIIVYSTGCPKCKMLEKCLKMANIEFIICDDTNVMLSMGMQSAPYMQIGEELMDFKDAMNWIKENKNG